MSTWGPKGFPQGVSSLQLTSRYEGLERGVGSLLLALSFLCGELKAARLEVCPRPNPSVLFTFHVDEILGHRRGGDTAPRSHSQGSTCWGYTEGTERGKTVLMGLEGILRT